MSEHHFERIANALEGIQKALENKSSGFVKKPVQERKCPKCGSVTAIRKDKIDDTNMYYCWKKLGGCGAKNIAAKHLYATSEQPDDTDEEPDPVLQEFCGKVVSLADYQALNEEEKVAQLDHPSSKAWIRSPEEMTEEDMRAYNLAAKFTGWIPLRNKPKWTREEMSIKITDLLLENTQQANVDITKMLQILRQATTGSYEAVSYVINNMLGIPYDQQELA